MGKNFKLKNFEFKHSVLSNERTYWDYVDRLTRLCLSMFEWNIPSSMDKRFLEKTLFYYGKASSLYTKKYGIINTRVASGGNINLYDLPNLLNCYTRPFLYQRKLYTGLDNADMNEEAVLIMDNWDMTPMVESIDLFAYRLSEAQKTIDVNLNAQRTPVLITCDEKQRLTVENLYSQYEGNRPVIFGEKNKMSSINIGVIDTKAPYVIDKIQNYKKEIWNEFLTFLGINNIDIEKKERMVSNETESNNEVINYYLQARLNPRIQACEEMNKLFKLDGEDKITVKLNSDLKNIIKETESIIFEKQNNITGGEVNE